MTCIHTVTKKRTYGIVNSNEQSFWCFCNNAFFQEKAWFRIQECWSTPHLFPLHISKCTSNSRNVCAATSPIQVIIVLVTWRLTCRKPTVSLPGQWGLEAECFVWTASWGFPNKKSTSNECYTSYIVLLLVRLLVEIFTSSFLSWGNTCKHIQNISNCWIPMVSSLEKIKRTASGLNRGSPIVSLYLLAMEMRPIQQLPGIGEQVLKELQQLWTCKWVPPNVHSKKSIVLLALTNTLEKHTSTKHFMSIQSHIGQCLFGKLDFVYIGSGMSWVEFTQNMKVLLIKVISRFHCGSIHLQSHAWHQWD